MAFWKDLVKKFRGEESPASEYRNQPETVTVPAAPPAAPAAKPPVPPIVDPAAVYRKIRIQALSSFYHASNPGELHCLVVNYSGLEDTQLEQALKKLERSLGMV